MPLDLARIHALCFDVDGTLSDTDDYYVARFSGWLRYIPFAPDPARAARRLVMWLESPGTALMGLTDTVGLDAEIIAVINWIYRHRRRRAEPLPAIPGVERALAALEATYPMAVISSRDDFSTRAFLEAHDLLKYFKVVVTALSAPRTKPYPDPVYLAAQALGVAARDCLMIGDTSVDIRAGRSAGAQTVGVLCGFGEEPELRREGADLILPGTADLADVLLPGSRAALESRISSSEPAQLP
jgi:HAD superfamily hydrolase (TIGR01509 family)